MRAAGHALAALLLASASAEAQNGNIFNRTGSGARAAGMANAFIAVSDDGTASSWNPAGLGQLRKPELSIVTSTLGASYGTSGFRARDDSATYSPTEASYSSTYLDFASLAVPFSIGGMPVTMQASWRRLYDLSFQQNVSTTQEPTTPGGPPPLATFATNANSTGGIDLASVSGAIKLTPRMALGMNVNFWQGAWEDHQSTAIALPGTEQPPLFVKHDQTNGVSGTNVGVGLLLTYPRWSVGVAYQGALTGDYTSSGQTATSLTPPPTPVSAAAPMHFPQELGAGVSWRPADRWTTALDLTWDDWSEATVTPPGGSAVDIFNGVPIERSGIADTLSANLGAECLFHGEGHVIPLRFGVAWEPQGARSAYTLDPVHFVMLAAGTGYNTNTIKFDAAFQYRWARFRDGDNFTLEGGSPELPSAVGLRDVKRWTIKLSLIVRVTDTDKLHRGIKKVFGGG